MDNSVEIIIKAFPGALTNDVLNIWEEVKLKYEFQVSDRFTVLVDGEILEIPHRIYEIPYGVSTEKLRTTEFTGNDFLILNCLLSRHHNGFIRQESLKKIISSGKYWITPYIFQLLGEYVIQILNTIDENLNDELLANFVRFVKENPRYFELTKHRVTSYRNCYYRHLSSKDDYVGFKIINKIENSQT